MRDEPVANWNSSFEFLVNLVGDYWNYDTDFGLERQLVYLHRVIAVAINCNFQFVNFQRQYNVVSYSKQKLHV